MTTLNGKYKVMSTLDLDGKDGAKKYHSHKNKLKKKRFHHLVKPFFFCKFVKYNNKTQL